MTIKPDLKSMMLAAIRMPTEEELTCIAKRRLSVVRDTYIENWPTEVLAMSIPTAILPLADTTVDALIERWSTTCGGAPKEMPAETVDAQLFVLSALIDDAITGLGGSAFVRLGSRSPKDCPAMMDGSFRILTEVLQ